MLKKIYQRFSYWVLPPGIQNVLKRSYFFLKNQKLNKFERQLLNKNKELKGRHQGERCFILATGASIRNQDLSLLKHEFCIAVSNFYLHPNFHTICPKYYCLAPWHPPHKEFDYVQLLEEAGRCANESTFFLGISERLRVQENSIQLGKGVYYLKFGGVNAEIISPDINLTQSILSPQSVSIMALQVAIFMGFSQIYLLGFDHDSILNFGEGFANKHFYTENKSKLITDRETFKSALLSYLSLWNEYEIIKEVAGNRKIHIYNSTHGGLLDVFDRVNYENLIHGKETFS